MMDALIITMINNSTSNIATRKCMKSMEAHNILGLDNPLIFPATTPETAVKDLINITKNKNFVYPKDNLFKIKSPRETSSPDKINYTWPVNSKDDHLDIQTGLYKKAYKAANYHKIVACTISHMRAWLYSIETGRNVLVLEHDAIFIRDFKFKKLFNENPSFGITSINTPIGATRRQGQYDAWLKKYKQENPDKFMFNVPSVNIHDDPALPQGLPGNSAYIIQPWAAEKLLEKVSEVGIWPNDALMCKEFFPWLKAMYPYVTAVQGTPSTTTG